MFIEMTMELIMFGILCLLFISCLIVGLMLIAFIFRVSRMYYRKTIKEFIKEHNLEQYDNEDEYCL